MTLAENVSVPLSQYTDLKPAEIAELVSLKLALVGLGGFEDFYPSEISGGMRKRAGLARAIALDPDILFFDEPSAGLDPLSSRRLDDLILELRDSLGATVVIVSHELASIFAIANNSVFLDADDRVIRPALLAGRQEEAFWIGRLGGPLTAQGIQTRIQRLSCKRFGIAFGPHRIRHSVVTTVALRLGETAAFGAAVVGNTPAVAEGYNHAGQYQAALRYAALSHKRRRQAGRGR